MNFPIIETQRPEEFPPCSAIKVTEVGRAAALNRTALGRAVDFIGSASIMHFHAWFGIVLVDPCSAELVFLSCFKYGLTQPRRLQFSNCDVMDLFKNGFDMHPIKDTSSYGLNALRVIPLD